MPHPYAPQINRTLRCLVLRDNPLGFVAARRLLQVVHASPLHQLDLVGCSFYKPSVQQACKDPAAPGEALRRPSPLRF